MREGGIDYVLYQTLSIWEEIWDLIKGKNS